jgi:hypothetical protein
LNFSSKFLIALEIGICIRVFNVSDERMFLAYLQIVICELILVMLVFCTLNFILIWIFGVFVEIRLALAIDSNLENLL